MARYGYSQRTVLERDPDLDRTRNLGIIAHIDAGKTTTTERMLYYSGFTRRIGDVDDGSTVTDFLPAERARGITIQSAAITFHWPPGTQGRLGAPLTTPRSLTPHTINLIDTPGHADFTFEVLRSLRILDGAVCILDGVAGVEAQTEKVWHQASSYMIPRIVYVNKLDRDGASFGRTVKEIGARLAGWPAVCQIPWWEGKKGRFVGVGDAIGLRAMKWDEGGDGKAVKVCQLEELEKPGEALGEEIKRARVALVELLSEHDDQIVEKFIEHDEDHLAIPSADIIESLRRCILDGSGAVIPVFAGASFRNIGVQPLLDAVIDLLPGPTERPDPEVSVGSLKGGLNDLLGGRLLPEQTDRDSHKKHKAKKASYLAATSATSTALTRGLEGCALAFKVVNDAKRGVLVYVRVYSGTINRHAPLFNTSLHTTERAPRLLRMHASDAVDIPFISAGQIGVIVGLKYARTGDTLISYHGANHKAGPPSPLSSLQLRPIDVPPPVFFASVEPQSLAEEKHLEEALALLLREDPSLHVSVDDDSGQTLLSGMGELHLEIARDRLVRDFKAKADMGKIEIGYRECVLGSSSKPEKITFDKEIAGKRTKAACNVSVEPAFDLESGVQDSKKIWSTIREGNMVSISIVGMSVDRATIDSPENPLRPHLNTSNLCQALTNGALAALARGPKYCFPMHSTHVRLSVDPSSDIFGPESTLAAFSSAARMATLAALKTVSKETGTALMEPVMHVIVSVDERSLGAVVHDISAARGGHIISLGDNDNDPLNHPHSTTTTAVADEPPRPAIDVGKLYAPPDPFGGSPTMDHQDSRQRNIVARVPLKEMVGYLRHLRSLTGGRGTFVMSVDRFERMGAQREKIVLQELRGL
ncbi:Ribosome-releasing factor 2, mitochondrial [Glutinoglossum americanum]|uniref:Ribosome-releasing factor 2, mitochondrial n=1 Tax=Glutinoglossum americanum TaxID=1670608 RepID=A0A9P8I776_9PEZI|nr:Ribosome-releasing factor 2, mitochondrial [Glutinoglossum americanum]